MKLLQVEMTSPPGSVHAQPTMVVLYHENGGSQIVAAANDEASYPGVLKILNRVCREQKLKLKAATLESTHLATAHLFYLEAQ